jgi:hypothetical protein
MFPVKAIEPRNWEAATAGCAATAFAGVCVWGERKPWLLLNAARLGARVAACKADRELAHVLCRPFVAGLTG